MMKTMKVGLVLLALSMVLTGCLSGGSWGKCNDDTRAIGLDASRDSDSGGTAVITPLMIVLGSLLFAAGVAAIVMGLGKLGMAGMASGGALLVLMITLNKFATLLAIGGTVLLLSMLGYIAYQFVVKERNFSSVVDSVESLLNSLPEKEKVEGEMTREKAIKILVENQTESASNAVDKVTKA